jgi:hypothetical protein
MLIITNEGWPISLEDTAFFFTVVEVINGAISITAEFITIFVA